MSYILQEHIEKSFRRLSQHPYQIDTLFQPQEYDWPGDWEGRALLAFCNLYELSGTVIPSMELFMEQLPAHLNEEGFLGSCFDKDKINEQQLSGHGWLLSGLMEYYRLFHKNGALQIAERIVHNLFLRALPYYNQYPCERVYDESGDVSGSLSDVVQGWNLSTDVGCAFICIDGMSRYYELTKDPEAEAFLKKTISIFLKIDKVAQKMQTHATLTATRGIMRFYQSTRDENYLEMAKSLFDLYTTSGMTDTYENYNWFGRENTWTEPCAVVDSLILAVELYKVTQNKDYHVLARRILFNGLSFSHRANGGAGPNSCVNKQQPYLEILCYEADFCCTMRYCEGLLCVYKNEDLFAPQSETFSIDKSGRRFVGDCLLVLDEESGARVLLLERAFPENNRKRYLVYY